VNSCGETGLFVCLFINPTIRGTFDARACRLLLLITRTGKNSQKEITLHGVVGGKKEIQML